MSFYFSDRQGGVSAAPFKSLNFAFHVGDSAEAVRKNREALATTMNIKRDLLHFMNQVHGCEIGEITSRTQSDQPLSCDALLTRDPGVALAVLVADCAPLLLSSKKISAAVHVGWRGLFSGIVEKVIEQMRSDGAGKIISQLGPTICGSCYEISEDLAEEGKVRGFQIGANSRSRSTLDIPASVANILKRNSIHYQNIGTCTFESELHFSFRREKITGRSVGVVIHEGK